ncbi:MAG TPA: hypothetical protein VF747_06315 [Blastocatellia bacterium]|jgi:hypothetical protein
MKNITETQPATPFDKFKELTQRLLAVPKKEIDARLKEYEKKKKRKKGRKA